MATAHPSQLQEAVACSHWWHDGQDWATDQSWCLQPIFGAFYDSSLHSSTKAGYAALCVLAVNLFLVGVEETWVSAQWVWSDYVLSILFPDYPPR
eukprot:COSAG03_NODE_4332_length_1589_cov_1.756376_3_plen_94_part_01